MSSYRNPAARGALLAAAALMLVLAACGSDAKVVKDGALAHDPGVPTVSLATTTLATTTTTLPSVAGKACKPATGITPAPNQPAVLMPVGVPPTKLGIADITKGTGKTVKSGDYVTVNYIGVACSTGKEFDSSYTKGRTPFTVQLSTANVIAGWVQGLPGMKVGGRRQLVIPPALGYGSTGNSGIAPGETLVFVIDLLSDTGSKPPPSTTTTAPATTVPATTIPATTIPATTTTAAKATTTTTKPKK